MRSLITGVVTLAIIVGVELPLAYADGTTSPGRNSVFVSKSSIDVPGCGLTPILTATIEKGTPHHVLMVQAMLLFQGLSAAVTTTPLIEAHPTVNGLGIEPSSAPSPFGGTHFSTVEQGVATTLTGMFWLDLDAAEIAKRNIFLGKPLEITLWAEVCNISSTSGGVVTHATMVGQLLEK
jgi:hypothetical protein